MICKGCNQDKTNYHFYAFRGNYNIAKSQFFTRPVYEIEGLCFDCAGPYRCLGCGAVKGADEFRLQGRYCYSCKSNSPTFSDVETHNTGVHVSSQDFQNGDWDIKPLTM